MRKLMLLALVPAALALAAFQTSRVQSQADTIIALERKALERWNRGDPQGYLESYAPDVTYFDPFQERRVDGQATMQKLYGPIAGKVQVDSYEMLSPQVQQRGDMAVLTFNLLSHARRPDGDTITVRWNSTEVYARARGKWSIIHSHWSFTTPGA